jgi:hypothetical protein
MNVFTKGLRKLMGWCPKAKITETGSQISPANFEAYDRSGGEKADRSGGEKARTDLSRMKRIGLLLASIGGFVSALTLVLEKDNISSLMVGAGTLLFLIGIILYIRS